MQNVFTGCKFPCFVLPLPRRPITGDEIKDKYQLQISDLACLILHQIFRTNKISNEFVLKTLQQPVTKVFHFESERVNLYQHKITIHIKNAC